MDSEASHLRAEDQFWTEFESILASPCDSHAKLDNVLRGYLELVTGYTGVNDSFHHGNGVLRCAERLLSSDLFEQHADYIRLQIIYSLLQEESHDNLLAIVSFLLLDGRHNETTFELMCEEGSFSRLLELIYSIKDDDGHSGNDVRSDLYRSLMDLLYEMSRIQRLKIEDLVAVDDEFIKYLFQLIEEPSNDPNDPYHYPVVRVLLVLNEQFMVSAHDPVEERPSAVPPTNKVIKILSKYGGVYKSFGENIILLLNREDETSLQLLTLKLLYLLFTTPSTYEYFYTNDLRVLVDILIRNLFDLPEDASALRHTHLRVLYPLLAHTQLRYPPHHKREELRDLLTILIRGRWSGAEESDEYDTIAHFEDVDETTKRLVLRCSQVDWLADDNHSFAKELKELNPSKEEPEGEIPDSPTVCYGEQYPKETPPVRHPSAVGVGMDLESSRSSPQSVAEVASHKESPGVSFPSRNGNLSKVGIKLLRPKPEPPTARRSRARRRNEFPNIAERSSSQRCPSSDRHPHRLSGSEPPNSHSVTGQGAGTSVSPSGMSNENIPVSKSAVNSPEPAFRSCRLSPRTSQPCPHSIPPALPPPRRSSQSVSPVSLTEVYTSGHQPPVPPLPQHPIPQPRAPTPPESQLANGTNQNQQVQKPEPPRTRRWRVQLQHQQQSKTNPGQETNLGGTSCQLHAENASKPGSSSPPAQLPTDVLETHPSTPTIKIEDLGDELPSHMKMQQLDGN
ncbi:hypothetical protein FQN57_006978 [Myotisia sp. PD_48]|nr:hypothetical protein FQN57_006978 [Myotisia sp. PD_48]